MPSIQIKNIIQKLPVHSYTKFCLMNRPTCKKDRRNALKKFLDHTRSETPNSKPKYCKSIF